MKLDLLIQKISDKIQKACSVPPLPELTNRTSQQGGFLPRKLQKIWKKHLYTYHLIIKAIYITKNYPNWQIHPIIDELKNHTHINIPPLPIQAAYQQEWIIIIANIAKTTNIQARKITTKYTQDCIKKTISKYRQLYEKTPRKLIKEYSKTKKHLLWTVLQTNTTIYLQTPQT
jgi:hypothetical protein